MASKMRGQPSTLQNASSGPRMSLWSQHFFGWKPLAVGRTGARQMEQVDMVGGAVLHDSLCSNEAAGGQYLGGKKVVPVYYAGRTGRSSWRLKLVPLMPSSR